MTSLTSAQRALGLDSTPVTVISPYRVNPLGAHVDHQGGAVLAKTINQHTVLSLWRNSDSTAATDQIKLVTSQQHWTPNSIVFQPGDAGHPETWVRFAQASAAAFKSSHPLQHGFTGYVDGAQIGAGLSSSASVVLAYLAALAWCNDISLDAHQLVELSRQVENEHMGLNNGIQDQMSIVFGKPGALTLLDVNTVTAEDVEDADNIGETRWILCYSGFSRELINSGFNTRVAECREAASLLDPSARILGQVDEAARSESHLAALPGMLARRARHFYSETARVADGARAWRAGDWQRFGDLMNKSCHSSITQYESGSQPMIDLHDIASATTGVFGSRFCGGGYGGCVLMLAAADKADEIQQQVLARYLEKYPGKNAIARIFVAAADGTVRIDPPTA